MRQEMYKLVGGQVHKYTAGQTIVKDGWVYSSPDEDMLRSVGFLPLGEPEIPDFDPTTHMIRVDHYSLSDNGDAIIAHYVVEELPPEVEVVPTTEERLAALEAENAHLKEALEMLLSGVTEDE